jgi:hypothetical protein
MTIEILTLRQISLKKVKSSEGHFIVDGDFFIRSTDEKYEVISGTSGHI